MKDFRAVLEKLEKKVGMGETLRDIQIHQDRLHPETVYGITIVTTDGYEVHIYNCGQYLDIFDNEGAM